MRLTRDLGCARESPDYVFDRDILYYAGIRLSENRKEFKCEFLFYP